MTTEQSLNRHSPVTMMARRRGAPTSPKTDSTATGSVAATMVPKRRVSTQDRPAARWSAAPTSPAVATTPGRASRAMGARLARRSTRSRLSAP